MIKFRNRWLYITMFLIIILLGLGSRKISYLLPNIVNCYLSDALWATMVYLGFATLFHRKKTIIISIYALLFSYFIEILQCYHAPWIDAIRNTTLGALVLGFGFLWSDILAYTLGVLLAFAIDNAILKSFYPKKQNL